jgi:hypothetical protein
LNGKIKIKKKDNFETNKDLTDNLIRKKEKKEPKTKKKRKDNLQH